MHNRLSNVERAVALVLSLVWTIGGGTAMVLAWRSGEWVAAAMAIFGVLYGVTWLRVVLLGRRLTWQESLHVGRHAQAGRAHTGLRASRNSTEPEPATSASSVKPAR